MDITISVQLWGGYGGVLDITYTTKMSIHYVNSYDNCTNYVARNGFYLPVCLHRDMT